ncbi:MAG: ABC transporter permease subunit [Azospirillaceae bacterium]|nr:ABC transporter permease subunit [Azospirillaceae bacterium]
MMPPTPLDVTPSGPRRARGVAARMARALHDWWGDRPWGQFALLIGAVAIFGFFGSNAADNMQQFGISPGFSFLDRPANFEIGESLIRYGAADSYGRAILVGLLNTAAVAVLGCILASVLGLFLGIARLSGNPLLSGLVQIYVEIARNTPLLLQLFFWNAIAHALPSPRQALGIGGSVFLSNRGVFLPAFRDPAAGWGLGLAVVTALALAVAISRLRRWRVRTRLPGQKGLGLLWGALVLPFIVLGLGGVSFAVEVPSLHGFNFAGGTAISPEFAALLTGLVVNSAATICEIVRSGIQAVPVGQWDAARALGLSPRRILRLVVLPQALRIIIPVTTSCYLDLTKNSSLAVAIGFPDLVSVINTTANQSGQVIETVFMMMMTYLTINLAVSLAMNRYHHRLARRGGVA